MIAMGAGLQFAEEKVSAYSLSVKDVSLLIYDLFLLAVDL